MNVTTYLLECNIPSQPVERRVLKRASCNPPVFLAKVGGGHRILRSSAIKKQMRASDRNSLLQGVSADRLFRLRKLDGRIARRSVPNVGAAVTLRRIRFS